MKLKHKQQRNDDPPIPAQSLPAMLLAGQTDLQSRWAVLLLAALTWVLSLPLFAPWGFWPAGYVVFVPWLLAIALASRPGWVYLVSYLLGAGFYLMHFQWLSETTVPGYLAASLLYVAPLFVPVAWITRHLHRTRGWCLAFAFPLAWTAQELAHSRGPLAFPWFLLGHSQYRALSTIQIADIAGAYGVSFVLAAVNGLIADLLLRSFVKRRGKKDIGLPLQLRLGFAFAIGLLGFTTLYGQFRLHQGGPVEGPKVAVVQGDFRLFTENRPGEPKDWQKREAYLALAHRAAGDMPDMIVLPETPWSMYLNLASGDGESVRARREFTRLATQQQTYVVVGGMTIEENKDRGLDAYPKFYRYNSAYVFSPRGGEPARYDKINLVLFGEYVPFRYSFHPLYRFLNEGWWIPESYRAGNFEYSCDPGTSYTVFPMRAKSMPGREFGFGVTICYEDVVPQVFRRFILDEKGEKKAGFMLNISNDGWFGHGTQQAQHLVNCAFRAVENRVGIARSVNTGISGFIRPDGSWYDLVQEQGRPLHAGGTGYRTARVILDPRITFYSRFGDALPVGWTLVTLVGAADAGRIGWKKWREKRKVKRSKRKGTR